ncbi:PEFG-CTERM sorting domain-containing protein [Nitrosopumilus sp. Nsub]|uniref:PEFG-CTERM sorting domain-containing protein n=1 Tax=Nitrosopumilus sp. Nsub TaxID=1776294 RepID=UPI00082A9C93|nr:PEFG-CTERM sorting domain-containing protein [Nitrosopumilus sp. Nsub]
MKTPLLIFALFGILITGVGAFQVFAENGIIDVSTDKPNYSDGDVMIISGEIKNMVPGDQLSILIQSPNGNLVALDQLTVSSDNQFSTEIKLGGKLMKTEGTYTIKVQYREQSATTSFDFGGMVSSSTNELDVVEDTVIEDTVVEGVMIEDSFVDVVIVDSVVTATNVTVQDSNDLISYEITNAKLLNVVPDLDAVSLLIYIETTDEGSITLTIPRSVLDASINGGDDEFFVLVDGEEVDFEEITTSEDRTLTIDFLAGTEQIEIIGTFVIPEFGTIAAMILAVAIISIVAISAKSRLNMLSKY